MGAFARRIAGDLPASLVVFLVALPLSMGIALASGAPIFAGLVAAAIGGIVVGLLGGAPLQVSGPAAGLAVLVFGFVERLGFPGLCAAVALAGVLQIALGSFRVARVAMAISPAVIHGMLAGIGIQIALAQLHVVLGGSPQSSAIKNLRELPAQVASLHGTAATLGLVTIAILLTWPLLPWKRLRVVPAALVAVVTATVIALFVGREDLPRVQLPDDLLGAFQLPSFPLARAGEIVLAGITIAIVASAESLLCAVATDKLHGGARADLDRELVAQGVGNVLSGVVGGLPITGVVVRSTANITAGAKTRWSGVLHGVWMVVFVALLSGVMERIPLAALAGLLVVVGAKLVDAKHVRELLRHREASVYFVTLAGVVLVNLLAGIGMGVAVAGFQLLRRLTKVEVTTADEGGRLVVTIRGALTFVGVPKVTAALARVPAGRQVDVDLCVEVIDHGGFEALHAWRVAYEKGGGHVDLDQLHDAWRARSLRPPPPVAEPSAAVSR